MTWGIMMTYGQYTEEYKEYLKKRWAAVLSLARSKYNHVGFKDLRIIYAASDLGVDPDANAIDCMANMLF